MTTTSLQPRSLSIHGIHLVDDLPRQEETLNTTMVNSASSHSVVARNTQRATIQQCRTFRYLGYITWTTAEGWTGYENDNVIAHRKGCITFRLPFTSTQLRMQYISGMGTPSYALNVTHIIQDQSKLGRRVFDIMTDEGDPGQLHRLLSGRELSLYSIIRAGSEEINLFFVSMTRYTMCIVLHGC